jgi:alkylated DNA repair dioxygenase AlkB
MVARPAIAFGVVQPQTRTLEDGAVLSYWPEWVEPPEADRAFAALRAAVPWEQRPIRIMGRELLQPRLVAWYGDAAYTYSGLTLEPRPWSPLLARLRDGAAAAAGAAFNSVLLNLYRDGADSMGMHQDDEEELGENPVIASVSLGATRRFVLRHVKKKGVGEDLELAHGSLLVMTGTTQHTYRHGLPKTKAAVGERINLTFRRIIV